jgi:hypothetical protein
MCRQRWQSRVRGVTVVGRKVYVTSSGTLKLGWRGPEVPLEEGLAVLNEVIADLIRTAVPLIEQHHARRTGGDTAEEVELAIPDDVPDDQGDADEAPTVPT